MKPVSIETVEPYSWGENCTGWHLVKSPALSVIQEVVPKGCSERSHLHVHAEQFFFVLSGEATLVVSGSHFKLTQHQGLHVPAGVIHQLRNDSEQYLIFTVTSTPPSHGDRVEA